MEERALTKDVGTLYLVTRGAKILHRDQDLATATAYYHGWPPKTVEFYEARRITPWSPAAG